MKFAFFQRAIGMHSSDIFNLQPAQAEPNTGNTDQIFSVAGSPSIRISRRTESNTSVFPSGCMGNLSEEDLQARMQGQTLGPGPSAEDAEFRPCEMPPDFEGMPDHSGPSNEVDDFADGQDHSIEATAAAKAQRGQSTHGPGAMSVLTGGPIEEQEAPCPVKMYQFEGSNIERNPLTGHGMDDSTIKPGKRITNARRTKWVW